MESFGVTSYVNWLSIVSSLVSRLLFAEGENSPVNFLYGFGSTWTKMQYQTHFSGRRVKWGLGMRLIYCLHCGVNNQALLLLRERMWPQRVQTSARPLASHQVPRSWFLEAFFPCHQGWSMRHHYLIHWLIYLNTRRSLPPRLLILHSLKKLFSYTNIEEQFRGIKCGKSCNVKAYPAIEVQA